MAQRSPSSPHHRHQASLESIIDFQTESPLSSAARNVARRRFYTITDHFEAAADPGPRASYNRSRLIRLTYDYACSPISQDNFLRAFFGSLELPMDSDEDIGADGVESRFFGFADYLFDNFFLPRGLSPSCLSTKPDPLTPSCPRTSQSLRQKDPAAYPGVSFRDPAPTGRGRVRRDPRENIGATRRLSGSRPSPMYCFPSVRYGRGQEAVQERWR